MEFNVLLVFMIIGALIAAETRDLLSAVISVGAVGFIVSLAFLFLKAPDIAITQVVVEVLTLVVLVRATLRNDITTVKGMRGKIGLSFSLAVIVLITLAAYPFFRELPHFGVPLLSQGKSISGFFLKEGLRRTGAANVTTSILLDFRMYDTIGEATILFASLLGALAILRRPSHKKRGARDKEERIK